MKITIAILAILIGMRLGTSNIRLTLRYLQTVPTGDLCYHEVPTRKDYLINTLLGGIVGLVIGIIFTLVFMLTVGKYYVII